MSRFGLDSQHSGDSGFYGLGRPEPVSLYETNMDPDDMRELLLPRVSSSSNAA